MQRLPNEIFSEANISNSLQARWNVLVSQQQALTSDDPELTEKNALIISQTMEVYLQMLEARNSSKEAVDVIEDDMFTQYFDLYKSLHACVKNDTDTHEIKIRLRETKSEEENEKAENFLKIDKKSLFKMAVKIFKPAKRISLNDITEITLGFCRYLMYPQSQSSQQNYETVALMRQWRLVLECMIACSRHIMKNLEEIKMTGFRLSWLSETIFSDLVKLRFTLASNPEAIQDAIARTGGTDGLVRLGLFYSQNSVHEKAKAEAFIHQLKELHTAIDQKIRLLTNPLFAHRLHHPTQPKPSQLTPDSFEEAKETVAVASDDNANKKARVRRKL